MKINIKIKQNLMIPTFYLFFIISSMQTAVGILGLPKYIFSKAQHDSWISIIIAYVFMMIVVSVMFIILNQYENADIIGIQVDMFGKWLGKALGTIYVAHFFLTLLSILLTYIQLVQIFLYPTMPAFFLGLLMLIIIVYSVLGGIRTIVGVVFIFFFLASWILILLYEPMTQMELSHFQPMFQASLPDLLRGAKTTSYTFVGFEVLLFIYPFIEKKKKAKLPVYLGITFTTIIVLVTTLISIGYYSPHDFEKMDWPVLTLFKGVSFSFLERFDYLVVMEWMMVSVSTLILLMWTITYGMKRIYAINQRTTLYTVAIIILIIAAIVKYDYKIMKLTDFVSQIGFWIVFIYPIFLLPIVLLKKKWRKRKGSER